MATTIDAHQHFWQLGRSFDYAWLDAPALAKIRRDRMPEHLQPRLRAAGIERTICVQTQHDTEENRWALSLAALYPFLAGVVGWVDLASPDCERQLLEFKEHPKFVGVRHLTQDEPDDDFLVRDDVVRGLKLLERHGVPFDLLVHVKQMRHVPALARLAPELPMVIDHLAKPHIRERRIDDWLPHLRAAAACPNVSCKLSGLITEANWEGWTADDLKPYVHAALDLFGPTRLMFGSDWPVCELAGSYEEVVEGLKDALGPIATSERAAIFGGTAAGFYKLNL